MARVLLRITISEAMICFELLKIFEKNGFKESAMIQRLFQNKMWIVIALGIVVLFFGCVRYAEHLAEQGVREIIFETAHQLNGTAELGEVQCSILSRTFSLKNLQYHAVEDTGPVDIRLAFLELQGISLSLVWNVFMQNMSALTGIQAVADNLTLHELDFVTDMNLHVGHRVISDIQMDMDQLSEALEEYLLQKDPTVSLESLVIRSVMYAESEASQIRIHYEEIPHIETIATVSRIYEKGFNGGSFERLSVEGFAAQMQVPKRPQMQMLIEQAVFDELTLSSDVFEALKMAGREPEAHAEYLSQIFLSEKPFLKNISLEKITLQQEEHGIKIDGFSFENTATNPFSGHVTLTGAHIPVSTLSQIGYLALIGYDVLQVDVDAEVFVPHGSLAGEQSRLGYTLDITDMGTFSLNMAGYFSNLFSASMTDRESDLLSSLTVSYIERGLLGHGARFASALLGMDAKNMADFTVSFVQDLIASAEPMPSNTGEQTPAISEEQMSQTAELFTQLKTFIEYPGTLTLDYTPLTPVPFESLEHLNLNSPELKLTVTKGAKSLEALIQ